MNIKNERKKERTYIIYIVIAILVLSVSALVYRTCVSFENYREKIREEENKKKDENYKRDFNSNFEFYVGTEMGSSVGHQLDNVISNNKTNTDHLVEVVFDGVSYGYDMDKIKQLKTKLRDFRDDYSGFQYYEVSIDYDSNGYINKITIETR